GVGDFNGDGKADFMYRAADSQDLYVLESTGTGFIERRWGTKAGESGQGVYEAGIGDINGDGKTDFLYRKADREELHVLIANGPGCEGDRVWGTKMESGRSVNESRMADVNNDGLMDFLFRASDSDTHYVMLSNGTGFEPMQQWSSGPAAGSSVYEG